ncbi:MAG: DUF3021 family protein [Clostridia bacterium]|nr:DUF3021 family protein [Clostridia bacterium]
MSKWIWKIAEWKFMLGLYFMGAVLLASIIGYFHGLRAFDFKTIWQIFAMCVFGSGLHYIYLTKLPMHIKLLVHSTVGYISIILFSIIFGWNYIENLNVFLQFTITFVIIYVFIFAAFSIYYKIENEELNKRLEEYKKKNK